MCPGARCGGYILITYCSVIKQSGNYNTQNLEKMADLYGEIKVCKFQFFFLSYSVLLYPTKNVLRTNGIHTLFELILTFPFLSYSIFIIGCVTLIAVVATVWMTLL